MNRLKGRFAARQILGGRECQEDDYGVIERGESSRPWKKPDITARTIRRCCSTGQKPILERECFPRSLEN